MALKDAWNALIGKSNSTEFAAEEETEMAATASDVFPVVSVSENKLNRYKKIPLTGLAAMGTAFAQLPEDARTIVHTVTKSVATTETLFVGINPKGIPGFLKADTYGTIGNIMQINEQGKQLIAGRMRFKPVEGLPISQTTMTKLPIDPMLMVVAVALMTIESKLDGIQNRVEEVLQFLKLEKQSKQRGNLDTLAEIMEDYKRNCDNTKFCELRNREVQTIMREARQDILFYQEQIAAELTKQKSIHGAKDSQALIQSVMYQFAEYQLACHIFAFSSFLDVMLQRSFEADTIESVTKKIADLAKRYRALYTDCHAQLAKYQRSAIKTQIVGSVGAAAKGLGKAIASVPVLREGPVDEALIGAGETIGKFNRNSVQKSLQSFEILEDNRMTTFMDNLQLIRVMYNEQNALMTDGIHLYVLQS